MPDEKKSEELKTIGAKLPEALTPQREKRMYRTGKGYEPVVFKLKFK